MATTVVPGRASHPKCSELYHISASLYTRTDTCNQKPRSRFLSHKVSQGIETMKNHEFFYMKINILLLVGIMIIVHSFTSIPILVLIKTNLIPKISPCLELCQQSISRVRQFQFTYWSWKRRVKSYLYTIIVCFIACYYPFSNLCRLYDVEKSHINKCR